MHGSYPVRLATGLMFGLLPYLLQYFMYVSFEGSGKTAQMSSLVMSETWLHGYAVPIFIYWLIMITKM